MKIGRYPAAEPQLLPILILAIVGSVLLLVVGLLCGCAPGSYVPPVSISAGFFGAQVTVAEPGYTVPAKVIATQAVQQPTLIVPASAPITTGSVPVITSAGEVSKV